MQGENTIAILRRLIDSGNGSINPASARAILDFHLSDADQSCMDELAAKSTRGSLTPSEELDEYDAYIAAADLLSLWKSQARRLALIAEGVFEATSTGT
jgi:hypothetical protein